MKIIIDDNAGFCFGVKNAVNTTFNLIEQYKDSNVNIYTYGPLIHNSQLIQRLEENHVYSIDSLDELSDKKDLKLIIRSHGISKHNYNLIKNMNIDYTDCTCPNVSNIHKIVQEYYEKDYKIFIVGDSEHPEVKGINGWCNNEAIILRDEKTVDKLPIYDKICLVAQTTMNTNTWHTVQQEILKKYNNVEVFNTICNATQKRQLSTKELSKQVDIMLVIGSTESSNTNKLYEISKQNCELTYFIQTKDDIQTKIFKSEHIVGITAGASTPEWIIKEVFIKMTEIQNELDTNMYEEYEKSFKTLEVGQIVKGTVISVSNNEVMVNIGYKADGIIKKEDFTWDREANLKEMIKSDDEVEVQIVNINDGEGNVVLSKKAVDAEKNWYKFEYALNEKTPLEGFVTDKVKGGLIVEIFGVRTFMPASQCDLRYCEDLNQFMNKKITVMVIEYKNEDNKKKVIVSRKEFLKIEKERQEKEVWNKIEEGQIVQGEVKRLTDFGAFVDIGGIDGLIHISELSWSHIKHPSEVLKIGQKIEAMILKINKETKKISLGLKQTHKEPWIAFEEGYKVEDIIDVKVLRFAPFGAFVEIIPGVDGLVHISQISQKRIANASDVLKVGENVKAKILEINPENKKVSLSIKDTIENTDAN